MMTASATIPRPAPAPDRQQSERMVALMQGSSLEVSARDRVAQETLSETLEPGATVYINHAAGDTHHGIVEVAARLRRQGFVPVPHIAARRLASFTQLRDFLARANGEAGVDRILAIAGDTDHPAGPFPDSLALLKTGLLQQHGIRRVGIAGYAEGHPKISDNALEAALRAKLALAHRDGLEPYVVTQFCFEAAPILASVQRLADAGFDIPVHVGLAGPASVASLAKFAIRCGIGNSIRALVGRQPAIARLMTETGPEPVISALASERRPAMLAGLHFFTFGGIARTADWRRARIDGGFLAPAARRGIDPLR
jgi:methylenetetrahydrofolate reductase (NADPH)